MATPYDCSRIEQLIGIVPQIYGPTRIVKWDLDKAQSKEGEAIVGGAPVYSVDAQLADDVLGPVVVNAVYGSKPIVSKLEVI